jgi:hypothetical protein
MPTALFARQHHYPFRPEYSHLHYIHHSKSLPIITEQEHVPSLISTTRVDSAFTGPTPHRVSPLRFRTSRRPLRPSPLKMTTLSYMPNASLALGGGPDSPPDLTNSKSSKSSSLHSSAISDVMGPSDLSHFEDINLDDIRGPGVFPMPKPGTHRSLYESSRPSAVSRNTAPTPQAAHHSFRDLTGGSKKPRHLNLKGHTNNVPRPQTRPQTQLHAPGKMRRGFTSPSAPSLANITNLTGPPHRSGSRSPSPAQSHKSFTSAPRTLSRKSSRNLEVSPAPSSMSVRRTSSTHRKTAKEREAECDDNDDDELPEDAIIWNVPMSPRPMQDRSRAPSSCGSPPQTSPSPVVSRPHSSRGKSPEKNSPAPSNRRPSPHPSNAEDKENQPPMASLVRQRTHTWESRYTTLDADARKLTEALEEYQTEIEHQQEVKRQLPGLSRSSSVERPVEPKRKAVSLPPIRKNDPLIDPLQPSEEKTKYLSRTRPSWLPPKDPKEEKKHLKEYQRMLSRIEQAGK